MLRFKKTTRRLSVVFAALALGSFSACYQDAVSDNDTTLVAADRQTSDQKNDSPETRSTEDSSKNWEELSEDARTQAAQVVMKAKDIGQDTLEKGQDLGTRAIEKSKEIGTNTIEAGKEIGTKAVTSGKEIGKKSYEKGVEVTEAITLKGRELSDWTSNELYVYSRDLVAEYGEDINGAGEHINVLLDKIARDPNTEGSTSSRIGRMAVLMVPLAGPTKRYADARKLYSAGQSEADSQSMQEARRECLIAFAEVGLDIGVLGVVGARIDLVATGADKVLSALKLSRNVNVIVGHDLKSLDDLLDTMLESKAIQSGIDQALSVDFAEIAPEERAKDEP